ncbi:hypothetical protein [Methanobacterium alcaliphilum]|uniref:hypothetical protein n=1 Tax=Methanobacterium alcaliphilum TaxID=392018 RepID=UPI00200AD391|nr:hypothetical protein [Methanobacterium alcaliphilum]MCK9151264.1 hypothetical protein [Methanobacterium alcaliphilum]
MIEKIEVSMTNQNVHNFKRGEFGVEGIDVNEKSGFIEIKYFSKEVGTRYVILPLNNVEKCDYIVKEDKNEQKK